MWLLGIPVRVVYTVEEPDRVGFGYGTLPGHPERGEEAFLVERHRETVHLVIRAFPRPANGWYRAADPLLRLVQRHFTDRYTRPLSRS